MRAILDLNTQKVLRICNSRVASIRAYANLQVERNLHQGTWKLAIAELATPRVKGNVVSRTEFTIVHQEK